MSCLRVKVFLVFWASDKSTKVHWIQFRFPKIVDTDEHQSRRSCGDSRHGPWMSWLTYVDRLIMYIWSSSGFDVAWYSIYWANRFRMVSAGVNAVCVCACAWNFIRLPAFSRWFEWAEIWYWIRAPFWGNWQPWSIRIFYTLLESAGQFSDHNAAFLSLNYLLWF